jgi:hypothetical protein
MLNAARFRPFRHHPIDQNPIGPLSTLEDNNAKSLHEQFFAMQIVHGSPHLRTILDILADSTLQFVTVDHFIPFASDSNAARKLRSPPPERFTSRSIVL